MRRLFILVFVLVLSASAVAALPAAPPSAVSGLHPVDPAGTVPPASLFKEGARGKLSTDLVQLIDPAARLPGQTRETVARGVREQRAYRGTPGTRGPGAEAVFVYVSLSAGSSTSLVDTYAVEVTDRDETNRLAAAWVSPDRLLALASQPFVRTVRTVDPPQVNTGSVTTEGAALLKSDTFRSTLGHAGRGMKIGVISDGVDSWMTARDTGDLPAGVHVLSNLCGGDEGTAMLEIVHDIAPEAELYFHDMSDNQIGFNSGITALADAGCQVIVDDIVYLAEPAFEDGIIASHVDDLVASRNIVYISSAGNEGNRHYQGLFTPEPGTNVHNFTNGAPSSTPRLYVNLSPGSGVYAILHWDDQWGRSANDYDLAAYLHGRYANPIVVSRDSQDGSGDPIEGVGIGNDGDEYIEIELNVTRHAGDTRTLEVYLFPFGGARVNPANIVQGDSIFGHAAASRAIAVAAADVASPASLEAYSSWGPSTIRWPSTELRQKPEIAGPDGNLISGAGDWGRRDGSHYRFYGTSASAPHVAALAALIWSGQPTASASRVRSALLETADDRGPAGFDYGWGHGWPNALAFARQLGVMQLQGPGGGMPAAAFGVSRQSGTAPLTVRFLDYSSGAATWRWDFGDGTTTVEHEPLHTYISPGRYTVSLTVANRAGTADTATKYDYIVATGPSPTPVPTVGVNFSADATSGPAPMAVAFTDASGGSPYHWWWEFGDGSSSTDPNPVHTYTTAGTYTVNLSVWTATGTATASKPAFVTIGADPRTPVANFTLSRTSGSAALYVRFTDASTGDPTSWRWDFGGIAWTTTGSPTTVFRQPGTYAVTLTATNAYGRSTATRNVTVTGPAAAPAGAASIAIVG